MGYGIEITAPNVSATSASTSQLIMSSKYPFIKLDTQSSKSFQTIFLYFNNDPPEPSGVGTQTTIVYSFAHGLTYTPRVWAEFITIAQPALTHFNQTYFQDLGVIAAQTIDDLVTMYITADSTNVYIKVDKSNFGGGSPNSLAASSFQISIYQFIDDFNS
jgi:hypothetical protein